MVIYTKDKIMYKIKLKYILSSVRLMLILFSLSIILFILSNLISIQIDWDILGIVVFIYLLPGIYLFIEYFIYSYNKKISIDFLTREITINGNAILSFEDIESIEKICSYPFAERRRVWLTSDTFFYYKVSLVNKDVLIITSFISDSIFTQKNQVKIRKKIIPSILF